ncbi:gamma carbonic anhydrase family protein [Adlercreutzia mucosicola]|uniref:gamma carbonic anhydrase family protein n=1 Tax=Adlercreutzia mucosicola TaxID=580026 RepID=UPI002B24A28E|nr:gamma carbonic anhydrase family protein [Adlercreutzia mucosicola]MEB1813488.1 gamma carbonic anhydrase family protein [Adlercreutzia mucosicola]
MDYRQVKIHPEARIAPNATIIGHVEIDRTATVLFNVTMRGDYDSCIRIGEGSNVQENSCLHLDYHQDCTVGRGCTIGHGAIVHGCTLGDNVLVGMGATVMNGAVVGSNSLIAAGALVTEGAQIPEGSLVVGVPGRVRRALTAEEIASNREAAEGYAAVGHDLAEQGILYYGADLPSDIRTIALA